MATNFIPTEHYRRPHKKYPFISTTILIADSQRRTAKYTMAVLHCLPCLPYSWLIACINHVRLLRLLALPCPSHAHTLIVDGLVCRTMSCHTFPSE